MKISRNDIIIYALFVTILVSYKFPIKELDDVCFKIPGEFKNRFRLFCLNANLLQIILALLMVAFIVKETLLCITPSRSENTLDDES